MHKHEESEDSYFVSKSQKKRDMDALQDLGKKLTEYGPARLKKVPMSDNLREALVEMARLTANGARARQLQYIGKLMRSEEIGPIQAALDVIEGKSHAEVARMHRLEKLRERFLEDETMLTEIGNLYPAADLHRMRQLRRNAIKERSENKPPKAYREIFQILREMEEGGVATEHPHHHSEDEGHDHAGHHGE
ncbi:ribosome biogenesis factor YjgA [Uliginosibacterium aquaticum]|uniref:Dual-action ribosomal maturation protein DarP n=1 Tax=Uliginosibacterium aquaticum TaxID=2731212 RepID=A0ABX2IIZ5_9RHOO|nr:ribosome biogenesis factor YjgA [Uliginosibacterium aquaticum]NSL56766.1 DUF615 domain-containing protein [Uliginosibacterium aquaticum]